MSRAVGGRISLSSAGGGKWERHLSSDEFKKRTINERVRESTKTTFEKGGRKGKWKA